jgi:hypothetical protein
VAQKAFGDGAARSISGTDQNKLEVFFRVQAQTQEAGVLPLDLVGVAGASKQVTTIPLDRSQALGRDLELGRGVGEGQPTLQAVPP